MGQHNISPGQTLTISPTVTGTPPYSFGLINQPSWVSINQTTGVMTAVCPATAAIGSTFSFALSAWNCNGSGSDAETMVLTVSTATNCDPVVIADPDVLNPPPTTPPPSTPPPSTPPPTTPPPGTPPPTGCTTLNTATGVKPAGVSLFADTDVKGTHIDLTDASHWMVWSGAPQGTKDVTINLVGGGTIQLPSNIVGSYGFATQGPAQITSIVACPAGSTPPGTPPPGTPPPGTPPPGTPPPGTPPTTPPPTGCVTLNTATGTQPAGVSLFAPTDVKATHIDLTDASHWMVWSGAPQGTKDVTINLVGGGSLVLASNVIGSGGFATQGPAQITSIVVCPVGTPPTTPPPTTPPPTTPPPGTPPPTTPPPTGCVTLNCSTGVKPAGVSMLSDSFVQSGSINLPAAGDWFNWSTAPQGTMNVTINLVGGGTEVLPGVVIGSGGFSTEGPRNITSIVACPV